MRFSTSLSRNIMETPVGGLIYKFKLKRRRHTLFFEDILSLYVDKCKRAGYGGEVEKIDQEWGYLILKQLPPSTVKKLPHSLVLNMIMKKIWINLGLMDDFHFSREGDIIKIKTKNEGVTRVIGSNRGMVGFYMGVLNALFNCQINCIKAAQTKKACDYTFKLENEPFSIQGKTKGEYDKLNRLPVVKGYMLKDMFEKGIFSLKDDNKILFRGRLLCPVENTIFHIIGNQGILLEEIPNISYSYFKEVIEQESTNEKKLTLLKTLLQAMGWGAITIVAGENKISVEIRSPPHGLQLEKDNWTFLVNTILGYLWLLNDGFNVRKIEEGHKKLSIIYNA